MREPPQALEQLTRLRATYLAQLSAKLDQIVEGCAALRGPVWDAERAMLVHRLVHNLAGSGASFGYSELSTAARRLELTLMPLREQSGGPGAPTLAAIDVALEALLAVGRTLNTRREQEGAALIEPAAVPPSGVGQTIFLVDDNSESGAELARQLGFFGYAVHTLADLGALPALAATVPPRAILMDLDAVAASHPTAILELLRGTFGTPPPLVFISRRNDLPARLVAVRAGGSAFVTRPVDVGDLVAILDALTNIAPPEPYRVLIVDDSELVARKHALILRAAGFQVGVVTDPAELLTALEGREPDLVLMDMYMPGCEGHELATIIRQQASYHGMPIVYLSGETNREIQLAALSQGGDDFLTKPVPPAHLVTAVKSRVVRARAIRGQLNRDSLTGLPSHGAIKEQLARELARLERYGGVLSTVMIDVDHFKAVNDTYGHATGDRVLKSLARLLRQQLRTSDVIGRYGGEEFVALLPETDVDAAIGVIERIRIQFAQIQHQAGEVSFTVTFSAGIAVATPQSVSRDTLAEADAALYTAKETGRNRTAIAGRGPTRPL